MHDLRWKFKQVSPFVLVAKFASSHVFFLDVFRPLFWPKQFAVDEAQRPQNVEEYLFASTGSTRTNIGS